MRDRGLKIEMIQKIAIDLALAIPKNKEEQLLTFKNRSSKPQIDYFIIRRKTSDNCKNCKIIPKECLIINSLSSS